MQSLFKEAPVPQPHPQNQLIINTAGSGQLNLSDSAGLDAAQVADVHTGPQATANSRDKAGAGRPGWCPGDILFTVPIPTAIVDVEVGGTYTGFGSDVKTDGATYTPQGCESLLPT